MADGLEEPDFPEDDEFVEELIGDYLNKDEEGYPIRNVKIVDDPRSTD